jgi:hypothetical protein
MENLKLQSADELQRGKRRVSRARRRKKILAVYGGLDSSLRSDDYSWGIDPCAFV